MFLRRAGAVLSGLLVSTALLTACTKDDAVAELPENCPSGDLHLREGSPALLPAGTETPTQIGMGIGYLRVEKDVPTVDLLLGGTPPSGLLDQHVGSQFSWGSAEWRISGICAGKVTLSIVRTLSTSSAATTTPAN